MINKIVRRKSTGAVMRYLIGPGRDDQHVTPHLTGGDPMIADWFADRELTLADAPVLARELDEFRDRWGTGGDTPVWHTSFAADPRDGRVPDETWRKVTADVARELGIDGSNGKPPARFVSVHHGENSAHADHIHFVAVMVRENGERVSDFQDKKRMSRLCMQMEERYGLHVLESRHHGRGTQGLSRAEIERTKRDRLAEPERRTLARVVRAVAAESPTEEAFVRGLRERGVQATAWYAKGSRGAVVGGYKVRGEDSPIALGGGKLAADLSLPRLRVAHSWKADEASVAAWHETDPPRRAARPAASPEEWQRQADRLVEFRRWLADVPLDDAQTYSAVAHEVSGALSAGAVALEDGRRGPLTDAADTVARSAETHGKWIAPRPQGMPDLSGVAALALSSGGNDAAKWAKLAIQLTSAARSLYEAHLACREAQRAREIRDVMVARVQELKAAPTSPPGQDAPARTPEDERARTAAALQRVGTVAPTVQPSDLRAAVHDGIRRQQEQARRERERHITTGRGR